MVTPGPGDHLDGDRQTGARPFALARGPLDLIATLRSVAFFSWQNTGHRHDAGGKAGASGA